MRVLIVEDEVLSQEELCRMIKLKFPLFNIVGLTKSIKATVDFLRENTVDLIFMDIELSDGNSLDVFDEIEVRTPVIFTTAYEQYALKAFQTSGVSYLLKPIKENDLVKAVEKINLMKDAGIYGEPITNMLLPSMLRKYKTRVLTRFADQVLSINIEDVAYFFAEDKVSFVVTRTGEKYFVDHTLDTLEKTLNPSSFFRITRNCIASIGSIKRISKFFNSRLKVTLQPDFTSSDLLVSRAKVADFMKWLDGEL